MSEENTRAEHIRAILHRMIQLPGSVCQMNRSVSHAGYQIRFQTIDDAIAFYYHLGNTRYEWFDPNVDFWVPRVVAVVKEPDAQNLQPSATE